MGNLKRAKGCAAIVAVARPQRESRNRRTFRNVVLALSLATIASSGRACADPILSGSVSFDPTTGLYTYSYTLDNQSGPAPIYDIDILIDMTVIGYISSSHTNPAGWTSYSAQSGYSALPPLDEYGMFWEWYTPGGGVPVGSDLSGFSLITRVAPSTSSSNDYFLSGAGYSGGPAPNYGVAEYGHVVAPLFPADWVVPEPSTALPAAIAGLMGLGYAWRRRKARAIA